jgi:Na+/H+ antiporter NhaD/arsenite permease-like protein
MTYINAMEERGVFDSLRSLFWMTGVMAFLISSFANNLTTAMLMCAIVLKVAPKDVKFINIACINIVVKFEQFFMLFVPSLVNFLVPGIMMSFFISNEKSTPITDDDFMIKRGAKRIIFLFVLTIITSVATHSVVNMPPVLGMMMGIGYLKFLGFYLRKSLPRSLTKKRTQAHISQDEKAMNRLGTIVPFDIFDKIARAEWDTLLFFYGVVMCVGGLGFIGYLCLVSELLYTNWNPTYCKYCCRRAFSNY